MPNCKSCENRFLFEYFGRTNSSCFATRFAGESPNLPWLWQNSDWTALLTQKIIILEFLNWRMLIFHSFSSIRANFETDQQKGGSWFFWTDGDWAWRSALSMICVITKCWFINNKNSTKYFRTVFQAKYGIIIYQQIRTVWSIAK